MNHQNQNNHLSDEKIARYVEVLQSEDWDGLPLEIQEHIEHCTSCHQQALDLYAIVSQVSWSEQREKEVPQKGRRLISMKIIRWAMAAVLVGLSFYFYRYLDRPKPVNTIETDRPIATNPEEARDEKAWNQDEQKSPTPKKEDTTNPPKSTTPRLESNVRSLYAANFVPSESMELLIADPLRSAGLELVQPVEEKPLNWRKGIRFEWTGDTEEQLFLQLEDNRAKVIYAEPMVGLTDTLLLDLEPGIYYWRLENEEDLLMVGRLVLE